MLSQSHSSKNSSLTGNDQQGPAKDKGKMKEDFFTKLQALQDKVRSDLDDDVYDATEWKKAAHVLWDSEPIASSSTDMQTKVSGTSRTLPHRSPQVITTQPHPSEEESDDSTTISNDTALETDERPLPPASDLIPINP